MATKWGKSGNSINSFQGSIYLKNLEVDLRLNKKTIFGPVILAAILIGGAISIIPSAIAMTQLTRQDYNTNIYPAHMGPQWRYMPHQYGPYGENQNQGWGNYSWEECPLLNYENNAPYGGEYPQPRCWDYD